MIANADGEEVRFKGYRSEPARSDELSAVADALNSRPRKTLGYRTPAEAIDCLLKSSMIESVAATG